LVGVGPVSFLGGFSAFAYRVNGRLADRDKCPQIGDKGEWAAGCEAGEDQVDVCFRADGEERGVRRVRQTGGEVGEDPMGLFVAPPTGLCDGAKALAVLRVTSTGAPGIDAALAIPGAAIVSVGAFLDCQCWATHAGVDPGERDREPAALVFLACLGESSVKEQRVTRALQQVSILRCRCGVGLNGEAGQEQLTGGNRLIVKSGAQRPPDLAAQRVRDGSSRREVPTAFVLGEQRIAFGDLSSGFLQINAQRPSLSRIYPLSVDLRPRSGAQCRRGSVATGLIDERQTGVLDTRLVEVGR
jgi:hypothetical protein